LFHYLVVLFFDAGHGYPSGSIGQDSGRVFNQEVRGRQNPSDAVSHFSRLRNEIKENSEEILMKDFLTLLENLLLIME